MSVNWVKGDQQDNKKKKYLFKNSYLGMTEIPTLGKKVYQSRLAVC